MNSQRFLSRFLGWLAVILFTAAMILVGWGLSSPVFVIIPSDSANARTELLMDAVCQGDLAGAAQYIYGTPDIQMINEHTNAINSILWDYYTGGIDYVFADDCYGEENGLSRDVTVRAPDLSGILTALKLRYDTLLDMHLTDLSDVDAGQHQRMILEEALNQVLSEELPYSSVVLKLNLVYQEEQWWIMPDETLLALLSGL